MAAGQAPDRLWLLGSDTIVNGVLTLNSVTSGTSQPIDYKSHGIVTFYFRSIGTTSGGTVLIEEADWGANEQTYSGTWGTVATIAASSFTGGVQLTYHIIDSSYRYLRVRISSPITGGGTIMASLSSRGAA